MTAPDLTPAQREALDQALQTCRVEDGSPAPLLRESDRLHVLHMLGPVVARMIVDAYEAGRKSQVPIDPDNHHNAALCPYCTPERREDVPDLAEARCFKAEAHGRHRLSPRIMCNGSDGPL